MPPAGNRFQTVFIGNLSYDGTEDELRSLFAQMGPISTLRVVVDRETGKRKGFAFLEFFDPDTAQRAMHELNGVDFYGRALRVSIAEQDTKHGDSSSTAGAGAAASRKRKGGPAGPPGSDRVASGIAGTTPPRTACCSLKTARSPRSCPRRSARVCARPATAACSPRTRVSAHRHCRRFYRYRCRP